MPTPIHTAEDFVSAFLNLLPRGRIWPKEPDSVQYQVLSGLAPTVAAVNDSANNLLEDLFPADTLMMLPDWENSLGLPDPCAGEAPTIQQRRAQVVARFTNSGGQSAAYFIAYALALGFSVTEQNYAPFRCGESSCGQQLGTTDWFFVWSLSAPLYNLVSFRCGQSTAGEPLQAWGNTVLECEMNEIKPAHTILLFDYF